MKRPLGVLALLLVPSIAGAQEPAPAPGLEPLPPSAAPATPEDFGVPATPAAPPPPPPPAPASAPPHDDEAKGRAFRPSFKGGLGYHYARVHDVPIHAGRLRLGVGAQNDLMAHYAMLSVMVGETETGRRAWDMRVGWSGDVRISIVRLGLDAEIGYLFIRRATIDSRMWALGVGAGAHAGVDVLTWGPREDHALTIDGRIEGHIHFGNAVSWGPSLSLGVRF